MKRKLTIITIILVTVFFIYGCFKCIKISKIVEESPDTPTKIMSSEEIISQVLRGEKEFINSDGTEILLDNLVIEDSPAKVNSYTYADIDGDSENELIAITDSYYGYYLVLDIDNNIIYGYDIKFNDMQYINQKGIVFNKTDDSQVYLNYKFNKSKYTKVELASFNSDLYKINGEEVVIDDFNKYSDDFASVGLVKYKSLNDNWMERKLNSDFSITASKVFNVSSNDSSFCFVTDNEFENFKTEYLEDKFSIYYHDSNGNSGKCVIKRAGDEFDKFNDILNDNKSLCLFDEDSQYIALLVNNDRLDSASDNNYDVYYFKYFNKSIQLLENYRRSNYDDIFNENVLSELQ